MTGAGNVDGGIADEVVGVEVCGTAGDGCGGSGYCSVGPSGAAGAEHCGAVCTEAAGSEYCSVAGAACGAGGVYCKVGGVTGTVKRAGWLLVGQPVVADAVAWSIDVDSTV